MKWFKNLLMFGKSESVKITTKENQLNFGPKCPTCGYEFESMPKRKRKCPECREWILRKRLPGEKNIRLVSEEEAKQIELAREEYNQSKKMSDQIEEIGEEFYERMKMRMEVALNRSLTHNEVVLQCYLSAAYSCLSKRNFGLYCIELKKIANILISESKMIEALNYYLIIVYLDCVGAGNSGQYYISKHRKGMPPGLLYDVKEIISETGLSEKSLKQRFVDLNSRFYSEYNPPTTPADVWESINELILEED